MTAPRVLVFLPCFTSGGAEKQGALLARFLKSNNYSVDAWGFPSATPDAPLRRALEACGVPTRELKAWPSLNWSFSRRPSSLPRRLSHRLAWARQLATYARSIPAETFDIVIPFTPWPSLVAALTRNRLRAAQVFWNHRGGFDDGGFPYTPFLVDQVLRRRPQFLANSHIGASFLRSTFGLAASAVRVIPNMYSTDYPKECAAQDPLDPGPIRLVHVANDFREKDVHTLLHGMQLLRSRGVACHLHLVGHFSDPNHRTEIEHACVRLGIQDWVTVHGALDPFRVQQLIRQVHIGVLSSRSEGMPNSVMEYMSWNLPVIATDVPGIRELLGTANAQCLFPVGDASRFAATAELLVRDGALRRELGHANRKRLEDEFSPDRISGQWLALLQR